MDLTGSDHFGRYAALQVTLNARNQTLRSIHVGVDTNFLLKIVRYRVRSLRLKNARTTFEECADAGILVPYAPVVVVKEVESHFEEFAKRYKLSVGDLAESWRDVRERINLFNAKRSRSAAARKLRARDPTDVPFLDVYEHLSLDVMFTSDPDWSVTGHRTVAWDEADALLTALRAYARAAGPLWTLNGFSVLGALSVTGLGYALWRAPRWVQLATLVGGAAIALSPQARGWLSEKGSTFRDFLAENEDFQLGLKRILAGQHGIAALEEKARQHLGNINCCDDAGIHALRALVASGGEASETDVGASMLIAGWRNATPDRVAEIRAALAARLEVTEAQPAVWTLLPRHRAKPVIETADGPVAGSDDGPSGSARHLDEHPP